MVYFFHIIIYERRFCPSRRTDAGCGGTRIRSGGASKKRSCNCDEKRIHFLLYARRRRPALCIRRRDADPARLFAGRTRDVHRARGRRAVRDGARAGRAGFLRRARDADRRRPRAVRRQAPDGQGKLLHRRAGRRLLHRRLFERGRDEERRANGHAQRPRNRPGAAGSAPPASGAGDARREIRTRLRFGAGPGFRLRPRPDAGFLCRRAEGTGRAASHIRVRRQAGLRGQRAWLLDHRI